MPSNTANSSTHVDIQFGVDTGSSANLISFQMFQELFPYIHLTDCRETFKDFSGNLIPVHGFFTVNMRFSSYESVERIYVVDKVTPPLIGIHTFETLHLHTLWSNKQVNRLGCTKQFSHEILLKPDAIPCVQKLRRVPIALRSSAKQFSHEILLKPDAIPCVQKLRRVPIALRSKVSEELKRLVAEDIIEPVDSSEWVSNVVVVQKPTGDV